VLRTMMVEFAVFAISLGSVLVAELPLSTAFGAGALGYGLLSTCYGTGALAGSLAGKRLTVQTERQVMVWASFVTAVGFGSVVFMPTIGPVFAAMVLAGASDGIVDVAVEVIFQRRSPDHVRSRVIASLEAVWHGGLALSFLFAGTLIDALGPKAAYALAGAGSALASVMLLPVLREPRRDPDLAS